MSSLTWNRLQSTRRFGSELIWISAGQAITILGSLVGIRLLTNAVDATTFGQVALAITTATLFQQILFAPLTNGATRFFAPACEKGDLSAYAYAVRSLFGLAIVVSIGLGLLLAIGLWWWNYKFEASLVILATIFTSFSSLNTLFTGLQNAARNRMLVAWHQAIESWLRYLLTIGLVWLFVGTASVVLMAYTLTQIVVLSSQMVFFRKQYQRLLQETERNLDQTPQNWYRVIVQYAWPFASWGVFSWMQQSSDRWALQVYADTSTVGHYAVLAQLGFFPTTLLANLGQQLLAPIFFGMAGDGSSQQRLQRVYTLNNWIIGLSLVGTTVGVGITALWHEQIFALLVAESFQGVSMFLPWMILAGGLFTSGQLAVVSLMSEASSTQMIFPKISTALIGVALSFLGAFFAGLPGVVASLVLTNFLYLIWCLLLVSNRMRLLNSAVAKIPS